MNRRIFACSIATVAVLASAGLARSDVPVSATTSEWHCKWTKEWIPQPYWETTTISLYKGEHRFFSYGKSQHINNYTLETEMEDLDQLFNGFKNMVNNLDYLTPADRVKLIQEAQDGMDDFYYE